MNVHNFQGRRAPPHQEGHSARRLKLNSRIRHFRCQTMTAIKAIALSVLVFSTVPDSAAAKDLMDTLIERGTFCTFLSAVRKAGFEDTLRANGPMTIFIPSDAAFRELSKEQVAALLGDTDMSGLIATIGRHIVPGALPAKLVAGRRITVQTVSSSYIMLDGTQGQFTIDDAVDVLTADIQADNGIIHVTRSVIPAYDPEY